MNPHKHLIIKYLQNQLNIAKINVLYHDIDPYYLFFLKCIL